MRIFGSIGYWYNYKIEKLVSQGNHSAFIGYSSSINTIYLHDLKANKWYRSPYFSFNKTYSSVSSHSLLLLFHNILSKVQLEDVTLFSLVISHYPYGANDSFTVTLLILPKQASLNLTFKDNSMFSLLYLKTLLPRHA